MAKKSQTKINSGEFSERFSKDKHKYDTLGTNLVQALKLFLNENDLKVLSVDFRTKDKDSFVEKIERKSYENPFDDIEDICGIRIICYYQSDVNKIADIISNEFEVIENQDKEQLLEADQFGYRSTHFIVKIKKEWLQAPNYRNLENLKAEIQIRTVLMHAWAEIEHKLAYKKESDIPKQFRNKFSQLAAILKNTDEQFEELKNKITDYKEDVIEIAKNEPNEISKIELNLDSLQAFLDDKFPNRNKVIGYTGALIDEFLTFNISMNEFISCYEKIESYLLEIEEDFVKTFGFYNLTQTRTARLIMGISNTEYFNQLPDGMFKALIQEWRGIIQKDEDNKKTK